jgi:hypothetical protein
LIGDGGGLWCGIPRGGDADETQHLSNHTNNGSHINLNSL